MGLFNATSAPPGKRVPTVDVHSHLYPPAYIEMLKGRDDVPYVKSFPPLDVPCLCNRPHGKVEPGVPPGRPLLPHYYDVAEKIKFMDAHDIDISVLSLGNPWLDFLPSETAGETSREINTAMETICNEYPSRLFFFAALPLTAPESDSLSEIYYIANNLPRTRGVVMGTRGFGEGLDDPKMIPIYQALADAHLPIFLHPNYGLSSEVWGCRGPDYGQILNLSLGFTTETTIAITRLFLSGAFTAVPKLQVILSHGGGTLPFLAGRIEACIEHDRKWAQQGKLDTSRQKIWDVLRQNIYLDAVLFDQTALKPAVEASGVERVMFGSDHPFFAPVRKDTQLWPAVTWNRDAVFKMFQDGEGYDLIMGGNAVRELNLR